MSNIEKKKHRNIISGLVFVCALRQILSISTDLMSANKVSKEMSYVWKMIVARCVEYVLV